MANYIYITLDTAAPGGVAAEAKGGGDTASRIIPISISCSDQDKTGYEMKIWGTAEAINEEDANWEPFSETKTVTLADGDGLKTIYVKVRDDVYNESPEASCTVTLFTNVPSVSVSASLSKISKIPGKDTTVITCVPDDDVTAFKMVAADSADALYNDKSNISICTAGGSFFKTDDFPEITASGSLEYHGEETVCAAGNSIIFTLKAEDIENASPGDGAKLLKVFVKSAHSGKWSE